MKKALALLLILFAAWQVKSQSPDSKDTSSGWIPIQVTPNSVLVPVMVNGHAATATLINSIESNYIDKDFVDKNNIVYEGKVAGQPKTTALTLQLGAMTVNQSIKATLVQHKNTKPTVDILLGDDIFRELVVDIDFLNQRISFHRPGGFIPRGGITPLPFKPDGESRATPASIEDGPMMYYWVYLGDPAPISVYQNYYTAHAMLQGRANSVRMGGGQRTPPEAIAMVGKVSFAGASFSQAPGVFPDDSVTGVHPAEVAGHIGLGILRRCHVIFDYSRDLIYVTAGSVSVVKAPFPIDHSGLVIRQIQDGYVVRFVCPGSPAMKGGFRIGDTVTQVNNQPASSFLGTALQTPAWTSTVLTGTGTTYSITLKDGTVRKLTTADFF